MSAGILPTIAATCLALAVAACVPPAPPTSPAASDHTWQVTGHRMPGADAEVRVIDVTCHGQPWTALGGRVLSFGAAGDFAVWGGVFFALRRVHL